MKCGLVRRNCSSCYAVILAGKPVSVSRKDLCGVHLTGSLYYLHTENFCGMCSLCDRLTVPGTRTGKL